MADWRYQPYHFGLFQVKVNSFESIFSSQYFFSIIIEKFFSQNHRIRPEKFLNIFLNWRSQMISKFIGVKCLTLIDRGWQTDSDALSIDNLRRSPRSNKNNPAV